MFLRSAVLYKYRVTPDPSFLHLSFLILFLSPVVFMDQRFQPSYVALQQPPSLPLPSIHTITSDPRYTPYNLPPLNFACPPNHTVTPIIPSHISQELNKISRSETNLPEQNFQLSPALIEDLKRTGLSIQSLQDRICAEAKEYAEKRKAIVRAELKERLQGNNTKFTAREKGKLRSRREAKVHRVKEQQTELALKASIAYLIELKEEAQKNACTCKCRCYENENNQSIAP